MPVAKPRATVAIKGKAWRKGRHGTAIKGMERQRHHGEQGARIIATVPGGFAAWAALALPPGLHLLPTGPPHLPPAIFSAMSLSSRHCALVMVRLSV